MGIKASGCAVAAGLALVGGVTAAYADTVNGTNGNDKLKGTKSDDVIIAKAGNDDIDPGGGADVIKAGAGRDYVDSYDKFRDRIYMQGGNDYVQSWVKDLVWLGPGNDSMNVATNKGVEIWCGSGRDTIFYIQRDERPRTHGCEKVEYAPIG